MGGSVCSTNTPESEHEGQTHFSTQHAAARADAWVPRSHGDQERPAGAETAPGEGTQAAQRQQPIAPAQVVGFSRNERVRRRVEYQRIYDRGSRVHSRLLTLFTLPNDLAVGRLGIAATKKIGGAVVRNRAKRLIREVFRRNKLAPGVDIVVVPKRELLDASLASIEIDFRQTLDRSLRRARPVSRV